MQAFDPASPAWGQWTSAAPAVKKDFSPYYQAAYDPAGRTVYCLSGGPILHSLSGNEKAWKTHPAAAELEGLQLAHDGLRPDRSEAGRRRGRQEGRKPRLEPHRGL